MVHDPAAVVLASLRVRAPALRTSLSLDRRRRQRNFESTRMWAGGDSAENSSKPWQSYHTVYTNAKAGMDGVDQEKVQRVVYEMSKGSKYFENEERKEADTRQKVESMRARCAKLSAADISHHQKVAEKRIAELEATRDLSRIWLHVDMDAFYAAVETLSNPSLKGKPMAVGGMSMISTANFEARKYGVRAAMPGFIARKLCPELIFIPTDFKKYTHYSTLTRKVFHSFDPNHFATSLDEAYLDITDICAARGATSEEIAEELRSNVFRETGLACSAGVAPKKMLAKIGGIGKVTEKILREVLGISTCEDMLKTGGLLSALFSLPSADFFLCIGLGLGKTDAPEVKMCKSMSNERTFSATVDEGALLQKLGFIMLALRSYLMSSPTSCGQSCCCLMKYSWKCGTPFAGKEVVYKYLICSWLRRSLLRSWLLICKRKAFKGKR